MSRIQLRKPLSPVKLKNPLLLRNALIKVFLNRNWTILHVQVYIQEKIVVFLVENVLYSNESLLSIPCGMVHCTVTRNDQSTEQNTFKKNQNLSWLSQITFASCRQTKFFSGFINEVKRNLTQLTTRRAIACCRSAGSAVAQARLALLTSSQGALYSVSRRPLSSFGLWIILFILLPPSLPPFISSSDKSVWQVPGLIGVGAHGWKARVYQGLACSRRWVSRVRCSDGGERVKS